MGNMGAMLYCTPWAQGCSFSGAGTYGKHGGYVILYSMGTGVSILRGWNIWEIMNLWCTVTGSKKKIISVK